MLDQEDRSTSLARLAGLHHTSDRAPGIRRRRAGSGFTYSLPDGSLLRDPAEITRIKRLAIPPAWTEVWICADPLGHLQATGRDARGRKQYRYHRDWEAVRDEDKFDRMLHFARALPAIRRRVRRDLRAPGPSRERVLATVVYLLETTFIRVGNDEYARTNGSFGLTTMRSRHVRVRGTTIRFRFRGKSGRERELELEDPRAARVLRELQELPGQEIFQYLDDAGNLQRIQSDDVNQYLREAAGNGFSAKDYRTWAGTLLCARELARAGIAATERDVREAVTNVAQQLGNTPAVCRRCYIHPAVIAAFTDGSALGPGSRRARAVRGLHADEVELVRLLSAARSGAGGGRRGRDDGGRRRRAR